MILPHEHVFVDLRTWDQPGYAQAETADVFALMAPELIKAREAGVTAIVECSTVGVGRRADILKAVSEATGFPLVAPTGIYREPWVPAWAHDAHEDALSEWMQAELEGQIEQSGVPAGFIKLSAGDNGLTPCETKILRAAARAAAATGAAIGSHTIQGRVVRDQLDIIENSGYTAERFIWIHAMVEEDAGLNLELARRGIWIEYDSIGDGANDDRILSRILQMLDAGLGDHLLLSQDRGAYDPAQPGGGIPRSYTYISEHFLPKLRAAGVDDLAIQKMTRQNPFLAFAR
ncbi:MAG: esterase [Chloroflexi bacterium]|nr:esterase [Chloroflexota bacterium]